MGLVEYKKKRSFNQTPEPVGGKSSSNQLQFVIQKHAASRLHYDFRLEMRGVLKSWAVPKGPSLNPSDKRLAMLVEDHPFDYKNFEGIIPPGNYGAGTVIIWDEGTYEPVSPGESKAENEKTLLQGFHAGQLKIRMHGQKLKGEFVLVRTRGRAENAWLLIKHRDEHATSENILDEDKSVVSGMTIEEVATDLESRKWKSNRSSSSQTDRKAKRGTRAKARTVLKPSSTEVINEKLIEPDHELDRYPKTKLPVDVMPMLATLVDKPNDKDGWLYEVKWDGYRALSYVENGSVKIRSRNNKDFNKKFYPIYNALREWNVNVVVDGEIIVVNDRGLPDFNALQAWRSEADGELVYYVFDLIWFNGIYLSGAPLKERRALLKKIAPSSGNIRLSESFDISASDFFEVADKLGLEGIVAKKADSVYTPGVRSKHWLKIKTEKHQEVVIAGYTRNENTNKRFSALLLGIYEGKELKFVGPVGTGFTNKIQSEIIEKLKPLETKNCPFAEVPDYNKPSRFRPNPPQAEVTWVKPTMVAEITYRALGSDGSIRHPSFKGLREDKKASLVSWETPAEVEVVSGEERIKIRTKASTERKALLNPSDETQVREIDGNAIKFTNLSKVFWPEEGVTKRDMLNYYYQVAPVMLPYYKDRPQTLNRFPNGIYGKSFYQKDVTGKVPSWIEKHEYYSETDKRTKNFLVISDEASLLYVASLGCIEMNPWSSCSQTPDNPDWCILDLDPDKNSFEQVIEAARVTHEVLEAIGVPSYCKTSGSTGLHIYIPLLGKNYSYEDSKEFGRALVTVIQREIPSFTSIERLTSNRKGKIYLDFLQNRPQATVAGPYSLRPKPGAPVSMPLHWEEVKKGLKILDFNIGNAVSRIRDEGDIFKGVLGKGVDIEKALKKLNAAFGKK
ncbi:MAG TPA: DNA ligase D [Chryseosolibacter sp.]|nr:DNA ligase D [Chryseosolibacter sp.]